MPIAGRRAGPGASADEPPPRLLSRRSTAYHEAGHAVVALRLGEPVARLEIAEDGSEGACWHRESPTGLAGDVEQRHAAFRSLCEGWRDYRARRAERGLPETALCRIIVLQAGEQAERRISPAFDGQGCGYDRREAQWLAQAITNTPVEARLLLWRLETDTRALVGALWGEIEAVAEALQQRGVLRGDEIAALLAG